MGQKDSGTDRTNQPNHGANNTEIVKPEFEQPNLKMQKTWKVWNGHQVHWWKEVDTGVGIGTETFYVFIKLNYEQM